MADRDDRRDMIDKHRAAGTCYLCSQPVIPGTPINGATGSHWDCSKKIETDYQEAVKRMDGALASFGLKPKRHRKQEGEGKTALKAKAMGVAAVEAALGVGIHSVSMWNQQGSYRGPRWDLDCWGISFAFTVDGHEFIGHASSLATMTQCVSYKRLKASHEDVCNTFTLWEDSTP